MITKSRIAKKVADEGIAVIIANGMRDNILPEVIKKQSAVVCTRFIPSSKSISNVKKWIAHSGAFARGAVTINAGARDALVGEKPSSLLMVGITKVHGAFKKGDVVSILAEDGTRIGLGKSHYDSKKAEQYIGEKMTKPFIHYHFLVLDEKNGGLPPV
jgi:glutamate 5-kinase